MEQVQRNIEKRGRLFEASIGNDYLDKIQESYFYFFKNQTQFPIVVIDLNEQDFVKNPKIYQELKNIMHRKYPPGLHHVKIINS